MRVHRETFGNRHAETLNSAVWLASLLRKQGKLAEAEPLKREALRVQRETRGDRHADTLSSAYGLATLVQDQDKFKEAIPLFETHLTIV